jgi:aldose 1-epimerase|tara:strand:+ start:6159 stop:7115 length:957 start_codon:yes stop_codon:yes gene_type:complete
VSEQNPAIIHLSAGDFHAEITPLGATLARFQFQNRDLILGLCADSTCALNNFYAGAIVGPVANRISNGHIEIDGQVFQMERNENGQTTLHSGSDGLHTCVWNVVEQTPSRVSLTYRLPDGYSGLPGNRDITVTYTLDNAGLAVEITAQTDRKTPMNIAHHPYWALEPDQSRTMLTIDAQSYLQKNACGLPSGDIVSVLEGAFDFTKPRAIGSRAELDHNWCLSTAKQDTTRHVATLRASDGLQLNVATTEVGLQVYTGSALPVLAAADCVGPQIKPNAGIALEPQGWPDAPNQQSFPSIMLDKGQIYRQITRYTISQT